MKFQVPSSKFQRNSKHLYLPTTAGGSQLLRVTDPRSVFVFDGLCPFGYEHGAFVRKTC